MKDSDGSIRKVGEIPFSERRKEWAQKMVLGSLVLIGLGFLMTSFAAGPMQAVRDLIVFPQIVFAVLAGMLFALIGELCATWLHNRVCGLALATSAFTVLGWGIIRIQVYVTQGRAIYDWSSYVGVCLVLAIFYLLYEILCRMTLYSITRNKRPQRRY